MKTKPYGVRFDIDKMELLKTTHDISTPQRAVNFLFDFWIQNKNNDSDILNRIELLEQKVENIKLPSPKIPKQESAFDCLYCGFSFARKSKKAIYCSDKCRNYANRIKNNLPVNNKMFIIDQDDRRHLLTKETLLSILASFDGK